MTDSLTETDARSPQTRGASAWLPLWWRATLVAAVAVTILDAVLLQRRDNYFTGGFLSVDNLTGPTDVVAFLTAACLANAAVSGVLAALVLRMLGVRLRPRAAFVAAVLAGAGPLIAADVLDYQLMQYLGDAVDVWLLFDLMGGDVRELASVVSAHALLPVAIGVAAVSLASAVVWLVHRREAATVTALARGARLVPRIPPAHPTLLLMLALVTTTGAKRGSEPLEFGLSRMPAGRLLAAVSDQVTDLDRDGYGLAGRLLDTAPLDARIHPYATDWPGNGIDEDGLAGDLPADVPDYAEPPVTGPWMRRPDVVLVLLESFRADLLGAQLNGQAVTPTLDGLVAHGVSAARAYSPNGFTLQSRFHLLSGSLAEVRDGRSLVDDFRTQGYTVAWVSGWDESFGGARYDVGVDRASVAFDARADLRRRVTRSTTTAGLAVPFDVVESRVDETLRQHVPQDRPLLLYVSLVDAHFPYTHARVRTLVSDARIARGDIRPEARDALWATYANTAANVDAAIGRVLARVRQTRGADPAVIVTADHGESLFDDGLLGHGHALSEVQTRVPVVVANLPMTIREPFSHVDLRDALNEAMRVPAGESATPRLAAADAPVFQYLGFIEHPRAIALTDAAGRVTYDFRRGRVQVRGGPWTPPAALGDADRDAFARVVRAWERLMVARSRSR